MPLHVQAGKATFQLVLIKPTHYDDDGYPITWLRSHIPSNTLQPGGSRSVCAPAIGAVRRDQPPAGPAKHSA